MGKFNLLLFSFILFFLLINLSFSQYWFQSGAEGSNISLNNNGASISIQTINQNIPKSSFAFWVGENLQNNAFIQIGYVVYNQSGYLHNNCTINGCSSNLSVTKNIPFWFYEYFTASNPNSSSFYGNQGHSYLNLNYFNNFSFIYSNINNNWNFYINNHNIGKINLGTSNSGNHVVSALAEYADASSSKQYMSPVKFKNFKFYKNNKWIYVPKAYSYISYGVGSETVLPNLYGVKEVSNFINYFVVGSGLPLKKSVLLWDQGYKLNIISKYGSINGSRNYSAYSIANINSAKIIYLNNTTRVLLKGFIGNGFGSYTGNSTNFSIHMNNNIIESAIWQLQYYVNVSSKYGKVSGTGWYNSNTSTLISLNKNIIKLNSKQRILFKSWNINNINENKKSLNFNILVNSPKIIISLWQLQYYVNVSSKYGKVSGTGWYNSNTSALISLSNNIFSTNNTVRYVFKSWNINNKTSNLNQTKINIFINSPKQIFSVFENQYKVFFKFNNAYGNKINQTYFNVNDQKTNNTDVFFVASTNKIYSIKYVFFKNTLIQTNYIFNLTKSRIITLNLPIYNITITAKSLLNTKVNASAKLQFKNNTILNFYLGNNGTRTFVNVPYGYAVGYIQFFGFSYKINSINGGVFLFKFFTPILILMIILVILIIIISYEIGKYYAKKIVRNKNI